MVGQRRVKRRQFNVVENGRKLGCPIVVANSRQQIRVVGSIGTAYGDYRVDDNRVVLIEWEGGVRSTIECGWWQLHLGGHEADTDVLGTGGYQRIWPLEQPAGYEHCGQPLFAAQMCEVTAALERFTSGDRSSRRGLTALAICDRASASAGVLV